MVAAGEEGAGARGRQTVIEGDGGRDGAGHRGVGGGPVGAAEVADVAAHEDKGLGRRARESGDVSNGVSGDVAKCGFGVSLAFRRRCSERWNASEEPKSPKTYLGARDSSQKRGSELRKRVQEVEATVAEEVVGGESADFAVGVEGDFVDGAILEVLVECWAFLVGRIPRHEILFEPRANV